MSVIKSIVIAGSLLFTLPIGSATGKCVLFIGDSITDGGWGRSGGNMIPSSERNKTDKNHLYGHSYMMLCAARYECDNPEAGIMSYNRGISGNTLKDLKERWDEDALELNPDIVSILIGTNDIDSYLRSDMSKDFDFVSWERDYRSLLDTTLSVNPAVRFVLGSPFAAKVGKIGKADNYTMRTGLLKECAEIVRRIADDYNAIYLPYDEMFDRLTNGGNPEYWIWDGIHPTPAGHQSMADLWLKNAGGLL
ncbi:MAG: SGNH/GDSL hydrolase family protein [Bacteroides sp.]|nr:SGNH/GDSL hydrolase family protein [Bacteroides sp.]